MNGTHKLNMSPRGGAAAKVTVTSMCAWVPMALNWSGQRQAVQWPCQAISRILSLCCCTHSPGELLAIVLIPTIGLPVPLPPTRDAPKARARVSTCPPPTSQGLAGSRPSTSTHHMSEGWNEDSLDQPEVSHQEVEGVSWVVWDTNCSRRKLNSKYRFGVKKRGFKTQLCFRQ